MPRITKDLYFNENELKKRLPYFYAYCEKKGIQFNENDFPVNLKTGKILAPLIGVQHDLTLIESDFNFDLTDPKRKIYNIGTLYIENGCSLNVEQKQLLQQLNNEINERNKTKDEEHKEDLICVKGGYGAGFSLDQIEEAANKSEDLYCKIYRNEQIIDGIIFADRSKVFQANSNIKNPEALYNYVTQNIFSTDAAQNLIDKILEAAQKNNVTLLNEEDKERACMFELKLGEINSLINSAQNEDVKEIAVDLRSIFEQLTTYSQTPDWEVVEKLLEKYNIQHTKPSAEIAEKIPDNSKVLDEWKNYLTCNNSISSQCSKVAPSCNVIDVNNEGNDTKTEVLLTKSTDLLEKKPVSDKSNNNVRTQRSFSF